MSRKHRVRDWPNLEKTPMIDVVFLLLIFFVFSFQQEDILAQLPVSRPQATTTTVDFDLLEVQVFRGDGETSYAMNGYRMNEQDLRKHMKRFATYNKDMSVIIKCTADSPHSSLVRVLDVCADAEMTNLSVFSM